MATSELWGATGDFSQHAGLEVDADGGLSLYVESCCESGEMDLTDEQADQLELALYRQRIARTFISNIPDEETAP